MKFTFASFSAFSSESPDPATYSTISLPSGIRTRNSSSAVKLLVNFLDPYSEERSRVGFPATPTPWASTKTFDSPCPCNQVTKNSLDFGVGAEREHPNSTKSVSSANRQLAARNFRNSLGTILIRSSFNQAALTHSMLIHLP